LAHAVDGRADQFSLAIIAFELLSGQRPFRADSLVALVHQIVYGERPSAKALRPDLTDAMDAVLKRGLAKDAADRYPTCSAFVDALETSADVIADSQSLSETQTITRNTPEPITRERPEAQIPFRSRLARYHIIEAPVAALMVAAGTVSWLIIQRLHSDTASVAVPRAPSTVSLTPNQIVVSEPGLTSLEVKVPARSKTVAAGNKSSSRAKAKTAPSVAEKGDETGAAKAAWEAKDYARLRALAEEGNVLAEHLMGNMYLWGEGVPKNYEQAVAWWRKAADQGSSNSQSNLGDMYQNGWGVPKDDLIAVNWFQKAADQGNAVAQDKLGLMYRQGLGVPKDFVLAVAWYRKAADQGFAPAQIDMGFMYDNGWGVPREYAQAASWYRKAADQGFVAAQFRLGVMYRDGVGAPQDVSEAIAWYRKAADQGYSLAQLDLGNIYLTGRGVPKDEAQAAAWFRNPADKGYPGAQNSLGDIYHNGAGVPKDEVAAVAWYRKAADRGYAPAQNNLGHMYQYGFGVPQDYAQAVVWYRKLQSRAMRTRNRRWG
jgi:TPR repeat protein